MEIYFIRAYCEKSFHIFVFSVSLSLSYSLESGRQIEMNLLLISIDLCKFHRTINHSLFQSHSLFIHCSLFQNPPSCFVTFVGSLSPNIHIWCVGKNIINIFWSMNINVSIRKTMVHRKPNSEKRCLVDETRMFFFLGGGNIH